MIAMIDDRPLNICHSLLAGIGIKYLPCKNCRQTVGNCVLTGKNNWIG